MELPENMLKEMQKCTDEIVEDMDAISKGYNKKDLELTDLYDFLHTSLRLYNNIHKNIIQCEEEN